MIFILSNLKSGGFQYIFKSCELSKYLDKTKFDQNKMISNIIIVSKYRLLVIKMVITKIQNLRAVKNYYIYDIIK